MTKTTGIAAVILAAIAIFPRSLWSADSDLLPNSVHGDAWAFGQSETRKDAIWHKGIDGDQVTKKTERKLEKDAANTEGGINDALDQAEKGKLRGSVGMSMANESSAWKVSPEQKKMRPDETMFRDRRHVVRAYAGVKAGDNLDISVGPELILKDEQHGDETANESQPDSQLGVGMQFKLDF